LESPASVWRPRSEKLRGSTIHLDARNHTLGWPLPHWAVERIVSHHSHSRIAPKGFRTQESTTFHATKVACEAYLITRCHQGVDRKEDIVNNIVWLVGAVVIVIAVLSFFGLR
jgi:hypothetical protein